MRIVVSLDSWPALRDFAGDDQSELGKAASLAELAGADSLRLGIQEELSPVRESDVVALRAAARAVELRMPFSPTLTKLALATRPDRVVLVGDRHSATGPVPLSQVAVRTERFVSGLSQPIDLTRRADGVLYVAERAGRVQVRRPDGEGFAHPRRPVVPVRELGDGRGGGPGRVAAGRSAVVPDRP